MRPLLAYLVLLLAVAVVYGRTLDAPLIWDDRHLILEAPQVSPAPGLAQRFRQPFWIEDGSGDARAYYRPLSGQSFEWDRALHGENPAGYHLTNGVLHALNALLLLALLLRRTTDTLVALLLSAAWALHPRLTEAAGWVSGRTDVLATLFCLLALLVHRRRSWPRSLASAALLFLGLASKEVALAGAAALLVRELWSDADAAGAPKRWQDGLPFTLPVVGILTLYAGLRLSALADTSAPVVELSGLERVGAILEALGRYCFDLAVPWLPRAQQGKLGQTDARFVLLALLALAGAFRLVFRARQRRVAATNENALGIQQDTPELIALAGGSVLLVLHVIPISVAVVAVDRFLYLPCAALALALARPLTRAAQQRRVVLPALCGLTFSLACATWLRLDEWHSELAFWRATYATTPKNNSLPGNELGNVYYRAGLFEQALRIYRVAAETVPNDPFVLSNTASALAQLGRYDDAAQLFSRLCQEHTKVASYCLKAALVEMSGLNLARARQHFAEAHRRAPRNPSVSRAATSLERLAVGLKDPALGSTDTLELAAARFHFALLAGRRPDSLQLAAQLWREPRAGASLRREAAEYYIRFGSPAALAQVARTPEAADMLAAPELHAATELRLAEGRELLEAWPALSFGSP